MSTAPSSRKRFWLWPAVLAVLLLAYTLGGFYGLPRLLVSLAQGEVAKTGRQLDVAELRFNPFSFEIHVEGFDLREADGAPLLAFASLYVDAEPARSIWERGLVLQALHWTGPDLSLVIEADGSVNLAKLIPPATEPEPPEAQPAGVPRLRIADLRLNDGRLSIEDRSRAQPFQLALTPIEFSLVDFRTALDHANDYAFSGRADSGEALEWSGAFTVQPLASHGRFALRNLQAATLARYLQDQLPMRLVSGVAETAGEYRLSLDPGLRLDLTLPSTSLRDWAVTERAGEPASAPLSIQQIGVHDLALSLDRREVTIGGVELEGLHAAVHREADGSLNLSRLFTPAAPTSPPAQAEPPATAEPPAAAPQWQVSLAQLRLRGSEIAVEDRVQKPVLRLALKPVDIIVTDIGTDFSKPLQLLADVGIGDGGRLQASGPLQIEPLSTQLKLDLKGLDLGLAQTFLTQQTGLALQSGRLAAQGQLSFAQPAKGPAKLGFEGAAQIRDLNVQDRAAKQDLLKWRALNVSGIAFRQAPDRLDIAGVDLVEPYARVLITPERELNLTRALASPSPPKPSPSAKRAAAAEPKAPMMPIRIKTIRVERGQLAFSDQSIQPQFSAGIFDLNGRIAGISTQADARASIDLKGKVDEFAPVLIQGQISPLAVDRDTDIALTFRNMDLIRFNPYSGRFAGYNIVKGKLSTELKYRIQDRALQAEHHVVVDQLEFGEATGSKDAVPLPVKLAVALLKDRHGVIDLGLPVSGSLDDPSFRVGPLVWKVLVNLLTKAVTAPFAALGALIGGGDELAWVEFAAGTASLSQAEAAKLDKLASALVERPQLRLDIPLAQVGELDAQALAVAALEQQLAGSSAETRLDALQKLSAQMGVVLPEFVEPSGPEGVEQRVARLEENLIARLKPEPAVLEVLAADRARAVQTRLLANAGIQPERVFFSSRAGGEPAEGGRVRMQLQLE